jgi:hypothetical protein
MDLFLSWSRDFLQVMLPHGLQGSRRARSLTNPGWMHIIKKEKLPKKHLIIKGLKK